MPITVEDTGGITQFSTETPINQASGAKRIRPAERCERGGVQCSCFSFVYEIKILKRKIATAFKQYIWFFLTLGFQNFCKVKMSLKKKKFSVLSATIISHSRNDLKHLVKTICGKFLFQSIIVLLPVITLLIFLNNS